MAGKYYSLLTLSFLSDLMSRVGVYNKNIIKRLLCKLILAHSHSSQPNLVLKVHLFHIIYIKLTQKENIVTTHDYKIK